MVAELHSMFARRKGNALESFVATLDRRFRAIYRGDPTGEELLAEPEASSPCGAYDKRASFRLPHAQLDRMFRILIFPSE